MTSPPAARVASSKPGANSGRTRGPGRWGSRLGQRLGQLPGELGVGRLPGGEARLPGGVVGRQARTPRREPCSVSALTKNVSSGRPRPRRAAAANFAPPSPWPLAVPATSGMPRPISVRAMINCGRPDLVSRAASQAARNASGSLPSTVCASQPMAVKAAAVSSLWVTSAMASRVTSLES
jgi:hypothetical protein